MHKALLSDPRYASAALGGDDIYAGNVRGHLWRSGKKNAPKILILPGFTEYCEKYAHMMMAIHQRGYDSLTIDWPGQGMSGHFGHDELAVHIEDFDNHINALAALIKTAGWQEETLHILGHSMGGHLAVRAADYFGDQVGSVIACAPMMVPRQRPIWFIRMLAWLFRQAGFQYHHVPFTKIPNIEALQSFMPHNPLTYDEAGFAWQTRWLFDRPELRRYGASNGWVGAAYRSSASYTLNQAFLKQLKQPFLIIDAADESIVSRPAIKQAADTIPNAEYHLMPNARHELFNEKQETYDKVWRIMDAFWAEQLS